MGNHSFYRAFKRMNYEVSPISLDKKGFNILHNISPYVWRFFYYHVVGFPKRDKERFYKRIIDRIKRLDPDMVFVIVGEQLESEVVKKISQIVPKIILWIGLDPEKVGWDNVIASIPYYSHIFIVDPDWTPKFEKWGAKNIFQQDLGVDEEIFKPVELSRKERDKYANALSFVGQWSKGREEFFSELVDFDLGLWGKNWKKKVSEKNPLYEKIRGEAFGRDIPKIYNASKIVINRHTPFTDYGINMRTYEAAGCGTFQLVDKKKGILKLFKEGESIVIYNNVTDLKKKIKYYLKNDIERENIADRSRQRVLKDHKYIDIVRNITKRME